MSDINDRFRDARGDVFASMSDLASARAAHRRDIEAARSAQLRAESSRAHLDETQLEFFRACLKLEAFESELPVCCVCGEPLAKAARRPRKTCSRRCLGRRSNLLAKEKQP